MTAWCWRARRRSHRAAETSRSCRHAGDEPRRLRRLNAGFEPARTFRLLSGTNPRSKVHRGEMCGDNAPLTMGFVVDMMRDGLDTWQPENEKKVPSDLPVLLITGEADPVSENAKTVRELEERYRANGVKDITGLYYPEARHELLNETNRDAVQRRRRVVESPPKSRPNRLSAAGSRRLAEVVTLGASVRHDRAGRAITASALLFATWADLTEEALKWLFEPLLDRIAGVGMRRRANQQVHSVDGAYLAGGPRVGAGGLGRCSTLRRCPRPSTFGVRSSGGSKA